MSISIAFSVSWVLVGWGHSIDNMKGTKNIAKKPNIMRNTNKVNSLCLVKGPPSTLRFVYGLPC